MSALLFLRAYSITFAHLLLSERRFQQLGARRGAAAACPAADSYLGEAFSPRSERSGSFSACARYRRGLIGCRERRRFHPAFSCCCFRYLHRRGEGFLSSSRNLQELSASTCCCSLFDEKLPLQYYAYMCSIMYNMFSILFVSLPPSLSLLFSLLSLSSSPL